MGGIDTGSGYGLGPVKFSRLPRRGVLLGHTGPQLAVLAAGLTALVGGLYTAGGPGLGWSAPIWVPASVLAWGRIGGRTFIEWAPLAASWVARTVKGQTVYRKNLSRPRPEGTLALPGDAAALRHYCDPETGAGMVHDPHGGTLSAVVEVTHPAFTLLDPGEQQRRITGWGKVLAGCCRSGRIARLQILERTLPDAGTGLADWWARHGHHDTSWAAQTYAELIERAGPACERHTTTICLALDLKAAARAIRAAGGGIGGAAGVLRQEMTCLTTALHGAELGVKGWLTPRDLAAVLRSAYDPAATARLDTHPHLGRELATAGPIAVREAWDYLRTDSGWHTVLWISQWPRSLVYPGFLAPVLLSSGVRRTFSLTAVPLRADAAARDLRKKKTEHVSDQAQRRRIGQIEDAAQLAEYADVLQQETDLAQGHGILRYVGLIAVTATDRPSLEAAVAAIEQAGVQASCETRRLVGQQAQAFTVAALPLARPT